MDGKVALENELRAQLEEWAAVVGRLRAKAEREHGDLRMDLMAEVERLAAYQRRAETYLRELHETQAGAWKDMLPGLELARGEMRQALDRAWKRIRIDPAGAADPAGDEADDPD